MKPEGQEKCGEIANLYESNKVIQNAQQQVIKITLFITLFISIYTWTFDLLRCFQLHMYLIYLTDWCVWLWPLWTIQLNSEVIGNSFEIYAMFLSLFYWNIYIRT